MERVSDDALRRVLRQLPALDRARGRGVCSGWRAVSEAPRRLVVAALDELLRRRDDEPSPQQCLCATCPHPRMRDVRLSGEPPRCAPYCPLHFASYLHAISSHQPVRYHEGYLYVRSGVLLKTPFAR